MCWGGDIEEWEWVPACHRGCVSGGCRGMAVGFSKEEPMANDCKDRRESGQNGLRGKEV